MELNRIGQSTIALPSRPCLAASAAIAGKKEGEGPLRADFDRIIDDDLFGEESWEKAEARFQYAAANSQRFVRNAATVVRITSGVHISGLHAPEHWGVVGQDTPQDPVDGADHGRTADETRDITGLHLGADVQNLAEYTVFRRPQDSFSGEPADVTRNGGVGNGRTIPDHPAQIVAPHGFYNGVTICSGGKTGAHRDDSRGVGDPGTQILFGKNGIHHHIGL